MVAANRCRCDEPRRCVEECAAVSSAACAPSAASGTSGRGSENSGHDVLDALDLAARARRGDAALDCAAAGPAVAAAVLLLVVRGGVEGCAEGHDRLRFLNKLTFTCLVALLLLCSAAVLCNDGQDFDEWPWFPHAWQSFVLLRPGEWVAGRFVVVDNTMVI